MMDEFVSKIVRTSLPASWIYQRFSTLENVAMMGGQAGISEVEATADQCTFNLKGMGRVGIQVLDREPDRTIKFGDMDARPLPFTAWIQLKEIAPGDTCIRLTLRIKLPLMLRPLLRGKLRKAVDQFAMAIGGKGAEASPSKC